MWDRGDPRPLSNFQNMHHGKQHYKILGIIRGVFVYVYFNFFSGSLSSPIIIYLKFMIISFSNPNVQHVFFFSYVRVRLALRSKLRTIRML